MTKAIAKAQEANLAVFDELDFGDGGFGDISSTDIVISRIAVVGDLSPQKKKGNAKYIDGVESGDIIDASSNVILARGFNNDNPQTLKVLPFARVKEVIEWKPRTQGGGIVSREVLTTTMENYAAQRGAKQSEKFEWLLTNGNELIETWQFYCVNPENMTPVFIPFKKSNLKMVRPWLTNRLNRKFPKGHKNEGHRVPLVANYVELGSFLDSGNNNEWPNFTVKDAEATTAEDIEVLMYAKELFDQLKEGNVKLDESGMDETEENIPF